MYDYYIHDNGGKMATLKGRERFNPNRVMISLHTSKYPN